MPRAHYVRTGNALLFPRRHCVPTTADAPALLRSSPHSNETESPPSYNQISTTGMDFEHPPSYFHSINIMGPAGYHFRTTSRTFRSAAEVQLTPTEVALLKDDWMLHIYVALPAPAREIDKARVSTGTFCWRALRYAVLRKVRVKRENVDDYGRWTGPEPR